MTIEELEYDVANMQVKRARDAYIAASIRWMRDPSYGNTIELGFWERAWTDLINFYGEIIDPSLKSATIRREDWEK